MGLQGSKIWPLLWTKGKRNSRIKKAAYCHPMKETEVYDFNQSSTALFFLGLFLYLNTKQQRGTQGQNWQVPQHPFDLNLSESSAFR